MTITTNCDTDKIMLIKKILIDLDGVLNEYGRDGFKASRVQFFAPKDLIEPPPVSVTH